METVECTSRAEAVDALRAMLTRKNHVAVGGWVMKEECAMDILTDALADYSSVVWKVDLELLNHARCRGDPADPGAVVVFDNAEVLGEKDLRRIARAEGKYVFILRNIDTEDVIEFGKRMVAMKSSEDAHL